MIIDSQNSGKGSERRESNYIAVRNAHVSYREDKLKKFYSRYLL